MGAVAQREGLDLEETTGDRLLRAQLSSEKTGTAYFVRGSLEEGEPPPNPPACGGDRRLFDRVSMCVSCFAVQFR